MACFARVDFNSNHWHHPSGPAGKCAGVSNWECTCGFGFEEWYRNEKFQKADDAGKVWQYGYLQCFKNLTTHQAGIYPDFKLFTRLCAGQCMQYATGSWWEVAHYNEIVVLDQNERLQAQQYFAAPLTLMRAQLINLGVDVATCFDQQPLSNTTNGIVQPKLNIKFLLESESYLFDMKISYKPGKGKYRYSSLYTI